MSNGKVKSLIISKRGFMDFPGLEKLLSSNIELENRVLYQFNLLMNDLIKTLKLIGVRGRKEVILH